MNILIIGKFSADQFGYHISDTLRDMGHQTIEFEPTLKYKYYSSTLLRRIDQISNSLANEFINIEAFRSIRKKRLNKILTENKIDFIIVTHDFLYPDETKLLKDMTKSPLILWFPDAIINFNKAMFIVSGYDFLFFKDPYIVLTLRNDYDIKNVFYLPECCNPKYHKPIPLSTKDYEEYKSEITTFGNPHALRMYFFRRLKEYNVRIWGYIPPIWIKNMDYKKLFTGKYVVYEEKAKAVLSSKIVINSLHPAEIVGINARAFEVAGIGGFQMIHWRPGLSQFFDDQKEIVTFKSFNELKRKIDYYLDNENERKKIAECGQRRAHIEHTYQLRIQLMLDTVFNNKNGFEIPSSV